MQLGDKERVTDTHVYFVSGPFSQWFSSEIVCNSYLHYMLGYTSNIIKFCSCEQWMMHSKAMMMKDYNKASEILKMTNSRAIKDKGREVADFDQELWDSLCYSVVLEGNILKFSQNVQLGRILEATGDRTIVEAAWYDKVWGVGLAPDNDLILDEANWQGQNLLGKVLMDTRDILNLKCDYDLHKERYESYKKERESYAKIIQEKLGRK